MAPKSPPRPSGYSGTPLIKKLGIRSGDRVLFLNAPAHYRQLLGKLPNGVDVVGSRSRFVNFVHFFADRARDLERGLPRLKSKIVTNGMIWVSWPKKSSGVPTDITEDVVRKHAFAYDLVDVKVCAVDDVWSGLKLVIRKEARGTDY